MDSIIPHEPPKISFFGKGNCSTHKKVNIYMNGTHNNVEKELYKGAGLNLVYNFEQDSHLLACTIGCFMNKSLNSRNVLKT